jgi:hypothetical protein
VECADQRVGPRGRTPKQEVEQRRDSWQVRVGFAVGAVEVLPQLVEQGADQAIHVLEVAVDQCPLAPGFGRHGLPGRAREDVARLQDISAVILDGTLLGRQPVKQLE